MKFLLKVHGGHREFLVSLMVATVRFSLKSTVAGITHRTSIYDMVQYDSEIGIEYRPPVIKRKCEKHNLLTHNKARFSQVRQ